MKKTTAILLYFQFITFGILFSQESKLQLLFVGDVMQHGGQIAAAYNAGSDSYDYKDCFKFVKPIIQQTDIAIANLEVTHAGKPYKGYPQFSAPPELSEAIVDAGFNVIITANNHSCDGGAKGVVKTLDVLDRIGVKHTGTFRNANERDQHYPLLVEKNGYKVAILNYTYGTNGLTVPEPLIINYIDSIVMKKDFDKAKKMGVDYIICTMHWGEEYKSLPNDYQKKWEAFCYKHGADMVIGSHPHVLQPVEQKVVKGKEKLTVWSLGNFVSNQRDRYKDGGMIVRSTLAKEGKQIKIESTECIPTWVFPRQEGKTKPFYILPEFNYLAYHPTFLSDTNLKQQAQFYADSKILFSQYNKNVAVYDVAQDSVLVKQYKNLLSSYYSVVLEEKSTAKFITQVPTLIHEDIHQFTTEEGTYLYLSGYYKTEEEALGQLNYLRDCGLKPIGTRKITAL